MNTVRERPIDTAYIFAKEAKILLRARSYHIIDGSRIVFRLQGRASSECWCDKDPNGRIIVRKDYIAISLNIQGLPPADFPIPEHESETIEPDQSDPPPVGCSILNARNPHTASGPI